jgi:hypothetical protein
MARPLVRDGQAAVVRASVMSSPTALDGTKEAQERPPPGGPTRGRAGRSRLIDVHPDLLCDLDDLVAPDARGDPQPTLRRTPKSTRQVARALTEMGREVSSRTTGQRLCQIYQMGCSLQATANSDKGWQPKGTPERVDARGFVDPEVPKAVPSEDAEAVQGGASAPGMLCRRVTWTAGVRCAREESPTPLGGRLGGIARTALRAGHLWGDRPPHAACR